jgi:flagellin
LAIRLSTNVASMGVNRNLAQVQGGRVRTMEKLSSGNRIVHASDDAAGLSISERLKAGIRSYQMAARNSNDGISLVQTAEGGIQEVQNILLRLRELSVQAASDTVGDVERSYSDREFQALKGEINRIAQTTKFNGSHLLNGMGAMLEVQVGIEGSSSHDRLRFSSGDANVTPAALGISGTHLSSKESARNNLRQLDSAIERVNLHRSSLGAVQVSLQANIQNVETHRTSTAHANSRIRDADMAEWTAKGVQQQIIAESGGAVLVQANNLPSQALRLLEGG